jgi:hypothetical protein
VTTITMPTGKTITIKSDEKLIVVNGEPKYVVQTSEDVITCIHKYALDNGLDSFRVNDGERNVIPGWSAGDRRVIDLTITEVSRPENKGRAKV